MKVVLLSMDASGKYLSKLAAIQLSKAIGCTVIGTLRKAERFELLRNAGTDHTSLDDETLRKQVLNVFPDGITKVLVLVGPMEIPITSKLIKNMALSA